MADTAVHSAEDFSAMSDADISDHLTRFYTGLRPLNMDLLQDIGSTELFLFEFDALLVRLLSDPLIDWTHGGEFLHLTFALERFLQAMEERDAAFRVVVFANQQSLWAHSPSLSLARSLLIEHMRRSTTYPVDELPSWAGPEFQAYLNRWVPACIVCSDGEEDPARPEVRMDPAKLPATVLRTFLLTCLSLRYHCVYATDITSRNNTLYGFVVRSQSEQWRKLIDALPALQALAGRMLATPATAPADAAEQLAAVAELVATKDAPFGATAGAWRAAAAAVAAGAAAKSERQRGGWAVADNVLALAKVYIVHTVLLRHVPLKHRAQTLSGPAPACAEAAPAFLAAVYANLGAYVRAGLPALAPESLGPALCDIADGRLFHKTLAVLSRPAMAGAAISALGLPKPVEKEVLSAWTAAAKAAGVPDTPLWPILGPGAAPHAVVVKAPPPAKEMVPIAAAATGAPAPKAAAKKKDVKGKAPAAKEESEESSDEGWMKHAGGDSDEEDKPQPAAPSKEEKVDEEDAEEAPEEVAAGTVERDNALLPLRNDLLDNVLGAERPLPMMLHAAAPVAAAQAVVEECRERFPKLADVDLTEDIEERDKEEPPKMDPDNISWVHAAEKALLSFPAGRRTKTIDEVLTRIEKGIKNVSVSREKALAQLRDEIDKNIREKRRRSKFVWHITGKVVRAAKSVSVDQEAIQKAKYVAFVHQYAESLGGVQATRVVLRSAEETEELARAAEEREDEEAGGKGKKGGKGGKGKAAKEEKPDPKGKKGGKKEKEPKLSKAEQMILENKKRRAEEMAAQVATQWRTVKTGLDGERNHAKALETLDKFLDKCEVPSVLAQGQLYRLKRAFAAWDDICVNRRLAERTPADYEVAVNAFRLVFEIYDTFGPDASKPDNRVLTGEDVDKLVEVLTALGLESAGKGLKRPAGEKDKAAGKKPAKADAGSTRANVGLSFSRFQLTYMGHLLEREKPSVESDPRVLGFVPDDWQRALMDVVDRSESALVCAPTSSGKTFVSFYAMEKVLRGSHDGVILYVAPTRALVNQVVADVYARYGQKSYPATFAGQTVFGIFMGGYQHNPLRSQVLVTDPWSLEQLLLSTHPDVESWRKKIKYAIYDEIHCINKDGSIWERVILLTRCPFVALSATVGNPHEFQQWLQEWQDKQKAQVEENKQLRRKGTDESPRSYRVHLVIHPHRYSDLQKWVYCPASPLYDDADLVIPATVGGVEKKVLKTLWPKEEILRRRALSPEYERGTFAQMHPCVSLDAEKVEIEKKDIFADLSFMPQDTLMLWDAMMAQRASVKKELAKELEKLDPDKVFPASAALTRKQARDWEADVKKAFSDWVHAGHHDVIKRLLDAFSEPVKKVVEERAAEWYAKSKVDTDTPTFLRENTLSLLMSLQAQNRLPALLFNFDQEECDEMAKHVILALQEAERVKRELNVAERKRIEKVRTRMMEEAEKAAQRADKKRKGGPRTDDDGNRNEREADMPDEIPELPEAEGIVLRDFIFTPRKSELDAEELEAILRPLSYDTAKYPEYLTDGLRRGIGVHHAGHGRKYRQAVERLFRHGHLRVVVATATLALGIHMPCRTVVFGGDSVHLDALQFRQMAGRAGRRGFDLLGHVVFFGVPLQKINRLMSARIPDLRGQYPLSATLALQLLDLNDKTKEPQRAVDAAECLFHRPLMTLNRGDAVISQIRDHMSFTAEYLQAHGFIDPTGKPVGGAGLSLFLASAEPSNLAFLSLFRRGVFHDIVRTAKAQAGDVEESKRILLAMLTACAYIFERVPLHVSAARDPDLQRPDAPCKVALGLPFTEAEQAARDQMAEHFERYNRDALHVLARYARTAARHLERTQGPEHVLPVSKVAFPAAQESAVKSGSLLGTLAEEAVKFEARSPFSAVSGHDDTFSTLEDLAESLRQGIYVDPGAVPTLDLGRLGKCLDAYVVDLVKSESKEAVLRSHGMSMTKFWNHVNSFISTVESLENAFDEISQDGGQDPDSVEVVQAIALVADEVRRLHGESIAT